MASPKSIREVRAIVDTTFRTTHINASSAIGSFLATNSSVHKIRVVQWDDSGCTQDGLEDMSLQTRMHAKPAPIPGLRKGAVKFSMYAGGAYSNVDPTTLMNFLDATMGGLAPPLSARSATVGAGTMNTTNFALASASTYANVGQAVLLGTRGDGKGGGEVRVITAVDDGGFQFAPPVSAAMAADDGIVFSTTAYLAENATQKYFHLLGIGHDAADQIQAISCAGVFKISKTGVGELPQVDFELQAADHQYAPAGSRAALTPATPYKGTDPAFDKSMGSFILADHLVPSARTVMKAGEFSFDPGLAVQEVEDPGGINGIGAYQHMPGTPKLEATVLFGEDMPGLDSDFGAKTAKRCILQFGHAAQKCFAIELPCCFLSAKPTPAALNNLSAVKISLQGTENYVTNNNLQSSAVRIHEF